MTQQLRRVEDQGLINAPWALGPARALCPVQLTNTLAEVNFRLRNKIALIGAVHILNILHCFKIA